jgi:hypothetical protein
MQRQRAVRKTGAKKLWDFQKIPASYDSEMFNIRSLYQGGKRQRSCHIVGSSIILSMI